LLKKNKDNKFKIIIIAGPTASGKSLLALDLAKKYNGIIINADSQQIYKGLPILSSQPTKENYMKTSHKLFNFLDFYKDFSVSKWFNLVTKEIELAKKRNLIPIIVGGTGMYINTLLKGLKVYPKISVELKNRGEKIMNKIGSKNFYNQLKERNKTCVYKINSNDKVRLLRSWEIFEVTKKSIYEINKEKKIKKLNYCNFFKILVFPSKKQIYINCLKRWNNMIKLGAISEVKSLIIKEKNLNKKNLIKTIGFKELKDFILNKNDINKASELALQATRNYAKRQCTWFRHQFKADIILKKKYEKNIKKLFLKEIEDKLLTN
tara:strand:+ start:3472 stop:4434 length:963 start_codon:yes stop_codon:yes gene_type:complete